MAVIPALGEAETGGSQFQSHPVYNVSFMAAQSYTIRSCLKEKEVGKKSKGILE